MVAHREGPRPRDAGRRLIRLFYRPGAYDANTFRASIEAGIILIDAMIQRNDSRPVECLSLFCRVGSRASMPPVRDHRGMLTRVTSGPPWCITNLGAGAWRIEALPLGDGIAKEVIELVDVPDDVSAEWLAAA